MKKHDTEVHRGFTEDTEETHRAPPSSVNLCVTSVNLRVKLLKTQSVRLRRAHSRLPSPVSRPNYRADVPPVPPTRGSDTPSHPPRTRITAFTFASPPM